jgi:hypothetical protein
MAEVVEESDDMATAWVGWIGGYDTLEELYLVERGLCIAGCGFDDFERDVTVEPDGGWAL